MAEDLRSKTVCVVDHGLFLELALRLSRDYGKVYYVKPWEKSFPIVQDCAVGDGFDEIERVDSIWDIADDTDLFVFPDVQHAALQRHIEGMGKRVWGSRRGDMFELKRAAFKEIMRNLGMAVGEYVTITGLDNLRAYLNENDHKFIKISKYRGNMESWHHVNYDLSQGKLDDLAMQFGPLQDAIKFVVEEPIETEIEVGFDGFCIDGVFSDVALQGYEAKDRGLIASVQLTDDMPEEIREVNKSLAGIMKEAKYRNFFSTEIRVDGKPYLIDPTCRQPSPSGEIQHEIWGNLSEIIWYGSEGKMITPEPTHNFGVEVILEHKGDPNEWRVLQIPDPIKKWVKLFNAAKHNDLYIIAPEPHMSDSVGAVVGLGDTIEDAIDEVKQISEALKDQPVTIDMSAVMDTLRVIGEAESKGIEFTDQPVPEPELAVK